MLDFIRGLFKKDFQIMHLSLITGHIGEILALLETEYLQDKSMKNAAIDAVIKLLEEQKDKAV